MVSRARKVGYLARKRLDASFQSRARNFLKREDLAQLVLAGTGRFPCWPHRSRTSYWCTVLSSMARAGNLSDILIKDGYNLILVQEPLTSLEVDVAASKP
jgi:hypothetical protein